MPYDVRDFQTEVIQASRDRPIVVDFWAEWCGPCRILGPILEKLAEEGGGRWRLAKVDTERFPEEAARYGVRGIPNVKLFVDGEPVDEFVGALPEAQVRQWLDRAIPSDVDRSVLRAVEEAQGLAGQGRPAAAAQVLEDALLEAPGHPRLTAELARSIVFDDPVRARELLASSDSDVEGEGGVEAVRQLADLLAGPEEGRPEPDPSDGTNGAPLDDAVERLRAWDFDGAFEALLRVLREESGEGRDRAARFGTALFRFLGASHPSVVRYRSEVASALYR